MHMVNSDLKNIEQEDHAEPLHNIARHIKVVMLLLLFFVCG